MKQLLTDSPDPYKALMSYIATPLPSYGLSPAELLMGRRIRTDVPQVKKNFVPNWSHLKGFRDADKQCKDRQKRDYQRCHRTCPLPALPGETPVWVDTPRGQVQGRIMICITNERMYITPRNCTGLFSYPLPDTVDDFIYCCCRSGMELEFRDNMIWK